MKPKILGTGKNFTCFESFTSRMSNLEAATFVVRYSRAIPQCQRLHTAQLIREAPFRIRVHPGCGADAQSTFFW